MFKFTRLLLLLTIAIGVAVAQFGPPGPPGPPIPSASSTSSTTQAVSQSTSTRSSDNTKTASTASGGTTNTQSNPSTVSSSGTAVSTSGSGASGNEGSSDSQSSSSGLSSTEKVGLGVGVGVGVAVIAAVAAMFLFARRRRRNTDNAGSFPQQTRTQPATRWGPPPLAGAAAVGRRQSPSVYSEPVTSSTRSMSSMGSMNVREPLDTTSASLSHHPYSRPPPRLAIPTPSPEEEDIIPEQKVYFEHGRPSPLDERPGILSPVSPLSRADSRPPSPLKDHEKW